MSQSTSQIVMLDQDSSSQASYKVWPTISAGSLRGLAQHLTIRILMRSYVIGDIHGCLDELRYLIEDLPIESGDRLIFLGDYVDRGPNSKGVLTYIVELQKSDDLEVICLKGNHEDMFLAYLGLPGQHGDMFLYNGGYATLISYGVRSRRSSLDEVTAQISPGHIDFLKNLRN
jgi:serine/threonine protein phosphatase 1